MTTFSKPTAKTQRKENDMSDNNANNEALNQDELETKVNDYLGQMHSITMNLMGDYPTPKDVMAYTLALGTHFSELMWANKMPLEKAHSLYEELFRSTYEQLAAVMNKDEESKDEEAK